MKVTGNLLVFCSIFLFWNFSHAYQDSSYSVIDERTFQLKVNALKNRLESFMLRVKKSKDQLRSNEEFSVMENFTFEDSKDSTIDMNDSEKSEPLSPSVMELPATGKQNSKVEKQSKPDFLSQEIIKKEPRQWDYYLGLSMGAYLPEKAGIREEPIFVPMEFEAGLSHALEWGIRFEDFSLSLSYTHANSKLSRESWKKWMESLGFPGMLPNSAGDLSQDLLHFELQYDYILSKGINLLMNLGFGYTITSLTELLENFPSRSSHDFSYLIGTGVSYDFNEFATLSLLLKQIGVFGDASFDPIDSYLVEIGFSVAY